MADSAGGEPEVSDSLKAFGEVVKAFRKRARLTQEQFAPRVRYSVPTVASIEQGRRFPPADFVDRSEEVLDAFGALRAAAKHLSRRPGLASWFRQWAKLEAEAVSLYTYECRLMPGLLQTGGVRTDAVHTSACRRLGDEQIEAQLAARLDRQRLFARSGQHGVQLHPGGAAAAAAAPGGASGSSRSWSTTCSALAELRNVEIQVMPTGREQHAGLDGPMQLAGDTGQQVARLLRGAGERPVHLRPESGQHSLQMRYAKTAVTGSHPGGLRGPAASDARSGYDHHRTGLVQEQLQRRLKATVA